MLYPNNGKKYIYNYAIYYVWIRTVWIGYIKYILFILKFVQRYTNMLN